MFSFKEERTSDARKGAAICIFKKDERCDEVKWVTHHHIQSEAKLFFLSLGFMVGDDVSCWGRQEPG